MRDILSNESRIVTKTFLILEDSRFLLEDAIPSIRADGADRVA